MIRCFFYAVLIGLTTTAMAGADSIISIGDYEVPEGPTAQLEVPVMVTGDDLVTDAAPGVAFGGGSHIIAVTDQVTTAGTIWESFVTSVFMADVLPDVDVYPNFSSVFGTPVPMDGVLFNFTVDLSSFSAGESFALDLDEVNSNFFNSGIRLNSIQYVDGSVTITPEPGTLTLMLIGLVGLVWVGGRRRR
jgi:hypothetical protein